jgi:CRP-like cAMP-binding protein
MSKPIDNIPPIVRLRYKKDDLILKEGDYGVSIYKVITGKVGVYTRTGDRDILLTTLGPGEIIGEMVFLYGDTEPRSASVRALEAAEIEVWHPARLSKEYDRIPQTLKYIIDQTLAHLLRINKVFGILKAREEAIKSGAPPSEPITSQRRFYRKEIDLPCRYRPAGTTSNRYLIGHIKDLSRGGLALSVENSNIQKFSHIPGDKFSINTELPTQKDLDLTAKIVAVRQDRSSHSVLLGMNITHLTEHHMKNLGFFLMP